MKIINLVVSVSLAITLGACAHGVGSPVSGMIVNNATGPYMATTNAKVGTKRGEATAISILGLFGMGDAGIETAAKNGGVSKIATVDRKGTNVLGLFATSTTIVTGE